MAHRGGGHRGGPVVITCRHRGWSATLAIMGDTSLAWPPGDTIGVPEAAKIIGVSQNTVRRAVDHGRLAGGRMDDRSPRRILRSAAEAAAAARAGRGTPRQDHIE